MTDFERMKEILRLCETGSVGEKLMLAAELSEIAARHDIPGDGELPIQEIMDYLHEQEIINAENS